MKKLYFLIFLLIAAFALQAQDRDIPNGYYDNAAGKTGDQLKLALHNIIKGHTKRSYSYIWTAYGTTDINPNTDKIWDIYSNYQYTLGENQCGTYTQEGNCYNREHLWARSWANKTDDDADTMVCDLHHVYPTDGWVNALRANYAFGEVSNATTTTGNGGKLGANTVSGYNGTVFEPIDEYKGDIARALMYMSVRYYGGDDSWATTAMTEKSVIKPWAMTMLLEWSKNDPVSQKEIDRNNAVYGIQGNRNPFIDHPEYARRIWDPNSDVFDGTFELYTENIVEGDYIIVYNGHAMTNTISSNKLTSTGVTPQNGAITNPSRSIVWHIANISNTSYWTIKNEVDNLYAAGTSGKNQMALISNVTDYAKWTPSCSNDLFEFENYGRSNQNQNPGNKWLRCNEDNNINAWAPYGTLTGGAVTLYKYMPLEYAYSINGELDAPTPVAPGASITLASGEDLNDDYTFAGWTDDLSDIENHIYTSGTSYQINNSVVLYAVYAHEVSGTPVTTYNKVTTAPSNWSGEYLIVYETASKVLNGGDLKDATGNYITVTISNNIIESNNNTNAAAFTIAKISNTANYTIKSTNNEYIGNTKTGSNKNGLNISTTTAYTNSISYDGNNNCINIQASNSTYLRFNNNSGDYNDRFRYYGSGQQPIQLYKKTTITPTTTTYYIQVRELPAGNNTLASITTADLITVPNGSILTITGTSNNGTTENLIIENGGQLIVPDNATVAATVRKSTYASTAKATNNWYAISSPINGIAIADFAKGGDNGHNVYRYIEKSSYWNEYRGETNETLGTAPFTTLTNGRGYLYRSTVAGVEFAGNVNSSSVTVPLTRQNPNSLIQGFNLIGNPFTHDIYKNDVAKEEGDLPAINSEYLAVGYYRLETTGTWTGTYGYTNPIKAGEAVLVKVIPSAPEEFNLTIANTDNPAAFYEEPSDKSGFNYIMFTVKNNKYTDVAYAMFNEGVGLNKIEHYNKDVQMLYVSQDDDDYSIAMMSDDTRVVNLGFQAKTMGHYSLSLKANGDFSYLHLIDKLTGEDVDMLIENEYSFIASKSDRYDRFIVRLDNNTDPSTGSETEAFAYQNGNEIVVCGEGELQVFDVMGRQIISYNVNGVETIYTSSLQTGVYILRLIGDDIKTQKIVVK